jgi:hypothetical protein
MDSSSVSTPEHADPNAIVNSDAGAHGDEETRPLALVRASSQDHAQTERDTQVEILPQGRTALLDYDLGDWETATRFATRTLYGQHVVRWVFEQILGYMTPSSVSQPASYLP